MITTFKNVLTDMKTPVTNKIMQVLSRDKTNTYQINN